MLITSSHDITGKRGKKRQNQWVNETGNGKRYKVSDMKFSGSFKEWVSQWVETQRRWKK